MRVSIRSSGPLTARPPIRGLTATQRARRDAIASRIGETARIGPSETYGLLGANTIASASRIASSTPGAGRASSAPANETASTSSSCRLPTNHSWNENAPAGVVTCVRSGSSVAGTMRLVTPAAVASLPVTAESGSPLRSACVRTRWSPRSRSPSRNQPSPPHSFADSSVRHVSPARPHPRSSSFSPASA